MTAPVAQVHFVGSVPFDSAETVFRTLPARLPGRLQRLPDGETSDRQGWVMWQKDRFPRDISQWLFNDDDSGVAEQRTVKLDDIKPTGYETAAIASYTEFKRLRDAGAIPPDVRFQVCLPSPANTVYAHVSPRYTEAVLPLYETRLLESLAAIQAAIPAHHLAIQWDMAFEVYHMEHQYGSQQTLYLAPPLYDNVKETIVERVARLARAVAADVELGFHFCYGDYEHKHFIEPVDTQILVELINPVVAAASKARPVHWVHLPVPKSRTDAAYFEPLKHIQLGSATPILGLVHAQDADGTAQRINTARRVLPDLQFAVSTECGLGRTSLKDVESILDISRSVTVVK